MFKNILVPIDGSSLSKKAMKKAISLAKSLGAKVTGFHVTPEYKFNYYSEYIPTNYVPIEELESHAEAIAMGYLGKLQSACEAAGVKCHVSYVTSDFPAEAILKAADKHKCDLIAMASHGRTGLVRLMLGSETQKVLANAKIPVLVLR
ncbi:MAG: universal stress protein [Burkholderiaceae bacterium]|jgi:nucleotide-binding universal stress UspA family protein